jgi:3-hydroxyacyl-[acyl-carrier-protein] dehydratase
MEMDEAAPPSAVIGSYNIAQIMRAIPHRYPFLLIDRVVDLVVGESAVGVKNVSINENFFQGHFPSEPVMPGVLLIESMAQTAAVLVVATLGPDAEGKLVYFMSIDNAKFRAPVEPGCLLHLHVEFVQKRARVCKFAGRAMVGDQIAAEAEFMAMIAEPPA